MKKSLKKGPRRSIQSRMVINKASTNGINVLKSTSKKELVLDGLCYFKDVFIDKNICFEKYFIYMFCPDIYLKNIIKYKTNLRTCKGFYSQNWV